MSQRRGGHVQNLGRRVEMEAAHSLPDWGSQKALPAGQEGADLGRNSVEGLGGHVTLPQECSDVMGAWPSPKLGRKGVGESQKSFFPEVPKEVYDGKRGQGQRHGDPWDPDRCLDSPVLGHVGAHLAPPQAARARQGLSEATSPPRRPGTVASPRSR